MTSAQSFPIALDIGGTWIKCARTSADGNFEPLERFANPCREAVLDGIGFAGEIAQAIVDRNAGRAPGALVMATAGEPDAAGRANRYLAALNIEDGGGEDISAVPDMFLLQPGPDAMVLVAVEGWKALPFS